MTKPVRATFMTKARADRGVKRLVDSFSKAMVEKLVEKKKRGWSGWNSIAECDLQERLLTHVVRAMHDPKQWIDVANFAAFLWWRHRNEEAADE